MDARLRVYFETAPPITKLETSDEESERVGVDGNSTSIRIQWNTTIDALLENSFSRVGTRSGNDVAGTASSKLSTYLRVKLFIDLENTIDLHFDPPTSLTELQTAHWNSGRKFHTKRVHQ